VPDSVLKVSEVDIAEIVPVLVMIHTDRRVLIM